MNDGDRPDKYRVYTLLAAWCFFLVAALNLVDLACTSCFIARFGTGVETNPLVVCMWKCSPLVFALYKAACSALFVFCGMCRRRFNKWCAIVAAPVALYSYVAGLSLYYMITLPP
jgi:hypothetical protein